MLLAQIVAKHGDVPSPNEFWLWFGSAGLAIGALAVAFLGMRARTEDKSHFVKGFFVCTIAACSYFAMASGQLDFNVNGDHDVALPRYIDWSITTPMLLLSIVLIALSGPKTLAEHRTRNTLIGSLLGADVLMILTGIFGALNSSDGVKWTWFAISSVFFLAIIYLLREVLARSKERSGADAPNRKLAVSLTGFLVGLWFIYPIVWGLAPEGLGVIGSGTETALFTILDLLAKTVFNVVLGLGVLKLSKLVTHTHGQETIDEVSEQLGSGEDHRFHQLGSTPKAAAAVYTSNGDTAEHDLDRELAGVGAGATGSGRSGGSVEPERRKR